MALCVMNPHIEPRVPNFNKCALKLLGINHFELTDEAILESVTKYIDSTSIEAFLFDVFNQFYILFLKDIDSTCRLIGKEIKIQSKCIRIFPLLTCYVIENVYPCVTNEELRDIFKTFGNVFSVCNHHIVPNSPKFSHVLSGKREITFLLPGSETEIHVPINIVKPPYSPFHIRKYCCGCLTEGHSVWHCPDIDDKDWLKREKECVNSDSEDEVEALIKSENIDLFKESEDENSLSDATSSHFSSEEVTKTDVKTSKEMEEPSMDISDIGTEKPMEANTNTDDLTVVASSATVSRFCSGPLPFHPPVIRNSDVFLQPLVLDLINETCGSLIIEANVMKHLLITDGRLKGELKTFASSYLDDMNTFLKLVQKARIQCSENNKYFSLKGVVSQKLKRIYATLSEVSNV